MANLGLCLQGSAIKVKAHLTNVYRKKLFLVGTEVPSVAVTSRNGIAKRPEGHKRTFFADMAWCSCQGQMAKPIQAPGGVSRPSFPIKSVCKACKLNLACAEH